MSKKFVSALVRCCVSALLLLTGCDKGAADKQQQLSNRSYTVKRGDFSVVFRSDGQLGAIKNHNLAFEGMRGGNDLKLTFVTPALTIVKSNDVIFRISEEYFKKVETEYLQRLQTAQLSIAMAEKDIEMIQADNINDMKTALDTLKTSVDAFNKYDKEDAPKKKRELQLSVEAKINAMEKADTDLTLARKAYADAYAMDEYKQMEAESKVNEAVIKVDSTKQDVDSAFQELRIFKRYDHPEKLQSARETVKRNTLAVQRGIVKNETDLTKKIIEVESGKRDLEELTSNLKDIQADMKKLDIRSPVNGTLYHGQPRDSSYYDEDRGVLREGKEVWIGQTIIPEEFRSRVKVGQPVHIKTKAIPDLLLKGSIEEIAAAATSLRHWDSQGPKVYATKISTDNSDPRVTSGMSVQLEIIVETIKEALYVPVEAVYSREGASYIKIDTGKDAFEERKVKTGRFSADFIELTEGVKEGDRVLLIRTAL
jgi:HlyD family secretion protein